MNTIKLRGDWEYNVLDIYNYNRSGKLDEYFSFIKNNHDSIDGDICEIGVYKGHSLISTAILLKEIGSDKQVWGFDSFSGFPSYHKYDSLSYFKELYQQGNISKDHYSQYLLNIQHKGVTTEVNLSASNISTSADFSGTSIELLQKKIDYFELDNIRIIDGDYKDTMLEKTYSEAKFMTVLMDCDLYESHQMALPFTWERMSSGGYMFLDEYYSLKFPGARKATDEFFKDRKEEPKMCDLKPMDFERWFVIKDRGD
jgi:hypothetical protein